MSVWEKKMIKKIKNAIYDFWMIKWWETILLWVSGWKDSMVLWYLLSKIRKELKEKFEIKWIYIAKDFLPDCNLDFDKKKKFFEEELNISLEKIHMKLPKDSKLNKGLGKSCTRCSYARRITLMKLAEKYKAQKICFWHHMDDIVVTAFMNMVEWKNLKIMPPINKMKRWDLTFIRPMCYLREKEIQNLANAKKIPYSNCFCEVWENTMRNKIKKQIIWENEKILPNYVKNIFWSLIKDFREKYEKNWYDM